MPIFVLQAAILECMRAIEPKELTDNSTAEFYLPLTTAIKGDDFLPESGTSQMEHAQFNDDVSYMMGTTSDESNSIIMMMQLENEEDYDLYLTQGATSDDPVIQMIEELVTGAVMSLAPGADFLVFCFETAL